MIKSPSSALRTFANVLPRAKRMWFRCPHEGKPMKVVIDQVGLGWDGVGCIGWGGPRNDKISFARLRRCTDCVSWRSHLATTPTYLFIVSREQSRDLARPLDCLTTVVDLDCIRHSQPDARQRMRTEQCKRQQSDNIRPFFVESHQKARSSWLLCGIISLSVCHAHRMLQQPSRDLIFRFGLSLSFLSLVSFLFLE